MATKPKGATAPETPQAAPAAPEGGDSAYVFSTLANDQKYIDWIKGGGDMSIAGHALVIKGGTGVANAKLVTPLGVATRVSADELARLQRNPLFQLHQKNGFITVRDQKTDPEKVAADMSLKDPSSPKTPANWNSASDTEAKPVDLNA